MTDTITKLPAISSSEVVNESSFTGTTVTDALNTIYAIEGQVTVLRWVDKNRTDSYTENGSYARPYKTFTACLNSITDASDTKRYLILAYPGRYLEALTLKSFVGIKALIADSVEIRVSTGNTITAPTAMNYFGCILEDLLIENLSATAGHVGISVEAKGVVTLKGCYVSTVDLPIDVKADGFCGMEASSTTSTNTDGIRVRNTGFLAVEGGTQSGKDATTYDIAVEAGGFAVLNGGVMPYNNRILRDGSIEYRSPAGIIGNDSSVTGTTVKDALNTLYHKVNTVTDTTNLDGTYYVVLCNKATAMTINLPLANTMTNRCYEIKNINVGVVTIDGNGAELIDGAATYELSTQWASAKIVSNGTGWYIL